MIRTGLSIAAMLVALTGCGPAPDATSTVTPGAAAPASKPDVLHVAQASDKPEITPEKIGQDMVGRVVKISDAAGARPPDEWTFEAAEFRQVEILEKQGAENKLTVVILMTTRNNPLPTEDHVQVTGKLQLQYEWRAGQWTLTGIQNLSFRYTVGVST